MELNCLHVTSFPGWRS